MCRCGTRGAGLVGKCGGRWMVGLDDLGCLFQPWQFYDSMNYLSSYINKSVYLWPLPFFFSYFYS